MEDLMTNAVHAETALLPEGWVANVRLTLEGGRIASVANGVAPGIADERHAVLVPAMPNLHSHAFQRAMAVLAETSEIGRAADRERVCQYGEITVVAESVKQKKTTKIN